MTFLLIAGGLLLLFVGAEFLVRGAVGLAQKWGISPLVIGLTIVGFGTSAPELTVSLSAALSDSPSIAIGNVLGSNIANMLLILGTAAVIWPIMVNPRALKRDCTFMLGITVIFVAIGLSGAYLAWHGVLLLGGLAGYISYSLWRDRSAPDDTAAMHIEEVSEFAGLSQSIGVLALSTVGGMIAVSGGAEMLVTGASTLARSAGISDEVIGLTLIAIGTSLPELATSIVAAYRRQPDVCLGNVLGSNIFNLMGIMGVTSLVINVPVPEKIIGFDLWILLGVTLLLMLFILTGRRISRWEGGVMLTLYCAYVASQFLGMGGAMRPLAS